MDGRKFLQWELPSRRYAKHPTAENKKGTREIIPIEKETRKRRKARIFSENIMAKNDEVITM